MNRSRISIVLLAIGLLASGPTRPAAGEAPAESEPPPGLVLSEFIFERAPFGECHASTVAETRGGLVAAWFAGKEEGASDVGIWVSRRRGEGWSPPVEVATGAESPEKRHPCWNPVLFQPSKGPLFLFYKVGPSPRSWWGVLRTSKDGGGTWSDARRLPDGILGPIKNKPIELPGGDILCPSSTEHDGWRVHFERTADLGRTWTKTDPVNDGEEFSAIQPTILVYPRGRLQALCRSRQGRIVEVSSTDGGRTWSAMKAGGLPNPSSGIDGVTLEDGRHLLVYNHTVRGGPRPNDRELLNVAVSKDGVAWKAALVLENEPGEFSYPAAIQTSDGKVHVTYTWKRERIKHVALDPGRLALRSMPGGRWPD
jgi:predicted neuraminidase